MSWGMLVDFLRLAQRVEWYCTYIHEKWATKCDERCDDRFDEICGLTKAGQKRLYVLPWNTLRLYDRFQWLVRNINILAELSPSALRNLISLWLEWLRYITWRAGQSRWSLCYLRYSSMYVCMYIQVHVHTWVEYTCVYKYVLVQYQYWIAVREHVPLENQRSSRARFKNNSLSTFWTNEPSKCFGGAAIIFTGWGGKRIIYLSIYLLCMYICRLIIVRFLEGGEGGQVQNLQPITMYIHTNYQLLNNHQQNFSWLGLGISKLLQPIGFLSMLCTCKFQKITVTDIIRIEKLKQIMYMYNI